jgi:hypothetical protein
MHVSFRSSTSRSKSIAGVHAYMHTCDVIFFCDFLLSDSYLGIVALGECLEFGIDICHGFLEGEQRGLLKSLFTIHNQVISCRCTTERRSRIKGDKLDVTYRAIALASLWPSPQDGGHNPAAVQHKHLRNSSWQESDSESPQDSTCNIPLTLFLL